MILKRAFSVRKTNGVMSFFIWWCHSWDIGINRLSYPIGFIEIPYLDFCIFQMEYDKKKILYPKSCYYSCVKLHDSCQNSITWITFTVSKFIDTKCILTVWFIPLKWTLVRIYQ